MDNRKTLILSALRAFINQRSGIEFGNYGDVKAFRAEQRGIQKDRREALELLRAVELSDGIDADALIKAARSAYGGRLTIKCEPIHSARQQLLYENSKARGGILEMPPPDAHSTTIDYCTGQYFVTEYRRAACAVLASALWEYARADITEGRKNDAPNVFYRHASVGDALRAHFARMFGRGIASRWFS